MGGGRRGGEGEGGRGGQAEGVMDKRRTGMHTPTGPQ